MRDLIARLGAWLPSLFIRRASVPMGAAAPAEPLVPPRPTHPPRPLPEHVLQWLRPLDANGIALVRPYLVDLERRREEHLRGRRRLDALLAATDFEVHDEAPALAS